MLCRAVAAQLRTVRPMLKDHVDRGLINPVQVKFVRQHELAVNARTGKSIEVLDTRATK